MSLITNSQGHWVAADGTHKPEPDKAAASEDKVTGRERAALRTEAPEPKPEPKPDLKPDPKSAFTVGAPAFPPSGGKR